MRKLANILDLRQTIDDSKFIVIGDIHGCFDEFAALLEKCGYMYGDFVISVGDLIDRGPKSREVIEWFMSMPNVYVVEGNHDNKARRYWAGRPVKPMHGLIDTVEQCKDMDTVAIAQWIESWPQIIQVPDIKGKPAYVVHAGVDGRIPMGRQPIENCLYARYFGGPGGFLDESGDIWYSTLDGSYIVISGHMMHANPMPTDDVFLLDGGAFQGGVLRALVVEKGEWKLEEVMSQDYWNITANTPPEVASRDQLVDRNLLRCDDRGDLRIYTYTDNCVHAREWNDITLHSRGIIFNRSTGEVVARPFSKFFNMGEREDTMEGVLPWDEEFTVFEKMDGWLGTLYRHEGKHCVATRGSFDGMGMGSWATEYLRENYDLTGLPDEVTLVFEIICPQTRIIVNYGDREDLVLLAVFNRHTGEEYEWDQVTALAGAFGFSLPQVFGSDVKACHDLLAAHPGNEMEGFVIRFQSGLRVKIKGEDYKRRASIVAHLTPLGIWKAMRDDTLTDDYRDAIDADYIDMYDELEQTLWDQYRKIDDEIRKEFSTVCVSLILQSGGLVMTDKDVPKLGSIALAGDILRKNFALRVQSDGTKHRSAMFSMLDDKKDAIRNYIIKLIRPKGNVLEPAGK